ncbi:MAG: protein kinase, partial [Oscillospiraceae bacterium]
MDNYKMCINCLSSYEADKEACPFCGNANKNTNPNGALAVGTVLGGRYTVGNFVEIDGEGVIYTGVNNVKKSKVLIKEYMPVTLCAGRNKDGSILPKPESEVLFKTSMMDFTEVYRTLINLNGDESLSAVEDIISANGTAYAVTEFVEGIDLEEYLDQFGGSLDWRDAMAMLEPLFITIEKLHRLNWVHLGICPSNIIVNEDGIAKLVGYATQGLRTQNSEIKATLYPGYSAPEQYSVTEYKYASTDIYALGAVLYRTITGRRPTSARDREREDTLPQVAQLTNVPRYVAAAINCALRLKSAERFTNV